MFCYCFPFCVIIPRNLHREAVLIFVDMVVNLCCLCYQKCCLWLEDNVLKCDLNL